MRVEKQPRPDDWDDRWYEGPGMLDGRIPVGEMALRLSHVWAAVWILSSTIGRMPLHMYRKRDDDGRDSASNHPIAELLRYQPNSWQTAYEFWSMAMGHVVLRGNFYAQIVPGPRGSVDQLIPRHPDRIEIETIQTPQGVRLRYIWSPPNGEKVTFTQDEIMHLRGLTSDGVRGLSVLEHASSNFAAGLAMEKYSNKLFSQGARPPAVLQHPKVLGEEAQKNLRHSIDAQVSGVDNAGRFLILEEGMTWQQVGMTSTDAQYLESREFSVYDAARWFNVPAHLLALAETPTYASIEAFDIGFVQHSIDPWAVNIEQVVRRDLISNTDYYAEFMREALIRGDIVSQNNALSVQRQNGIINADEWRAKINMNKRPGGDVYLEPMNMTRVGPDGNAIAAPGQGGELPQTSRAQQLAAASTERILRREHGAVQKALKQFAGDPDGYRKWAQAFYIDHATFVADALAISEASAVMYCTIRQTTSYLRTEITDADRDALVAIALQEESRAA
jgi:HK97 family phage portal protein